ncbi:TMV resistance protein N-like [Neltuma alba]|uniref:TMV resistance protein N-like n=1 Tax=Neltuma alba TaxID=207710 RepID=UPI0010A3D0C1|nr:TMV resistance protein N-like [Prosopis alba]
MSSLDTAISFPPQLELVQKKERPKLASTRSSAQSHDTTHLSSSNFSWAFLDSLMCMFFPPSLLPGVVAVNRRLDIPDRVTLLPRTLAARPRTLLIHLTIVTSEPSPADSVSLLPSPACNGYEVFLSFCRGEETPESFPSCLYSSLSKKGYSVFKDDISIELLQSVRCPKIFIIIFSKDYASSRMCLEELTKIMKFRSMPYDHVVLPIFYDVSQSEICNQESIKGRIQKVSPTEEEVSRWRRALREAARNVPGIHISDYIKFGYLHDEYVMEDIIYYADDFLKTLDKVFPVGVDSRAQDVISMLHNHKSKRVVFIGIWGMRGIGKTTIAKAVFNHIQCAFESTCFLPNVGEQSERKVDLVSVICKATDMRIKSTESRTLDLNERPCQKKVLLGLDDVNQLEQLNTLCGSREQFGEGSIIIITTSDLYLLNAFQVDDIYCMKLLSDEESLQLLSWHAFQQAYPKGEFIDACKEVVVYAEGLPLALTTDIDSILNEEELDQRESILWNMNRALHPVIYNKLRLSFDYLNAEEKEIFLNIVLFHIGRDMDDVIQKLNAHGSNAHIRIRVLEDRGLVTIDNNKFRMHNLLQVMGRQIVRETSQSELEGRLWFCRDALCASCIISTCLYQ